MKIETQVLVVNPYKIQKKDFVSMFLYWHFMIASKIEFLL